MSLAKRRSAHATTNRALPSAVVFTLTLLAANQMFAEKANDAEAIKDHVPKPGVFPPAGAGIHHNGDLVISDPMNRRGALRKSQHAKRHYFAMLPYGMVWYHGAPADIRDIPPGTHMHGRFLLPLEGEEKTIPISEERLKQTPTLRYNHAILLEDDASFYSRRGRSWKVLGFEQGAGPAPRLKLSVEPVGPEIEGSINKPALFDIDDGTRVWKNRQLVDKDQIKPGQEVQVNLTWGPFDSMATTDVWLDEESLAACRKIQRQRHLRLIRSRFLPGWVDAVKNNDTGGGEVKITLFGGMAPVLYRELKQGKTPKVCDAANTLRTWSYHQEYSVRGQTVEWNESENPPLGSSGIQMRVKLPQMLEGFRPGRIVRLKGPWTYVLLPADEWLATPEEFEVSSKLRLP